MSKQYLSGTWANGEYLNWDVDEDKRSILKKRWLKDSPLIIFDEIHDIIPSFIGNIKTIYGINLNINKSELTSGFEVNKS